MQAFTFAVTLMSPRRLYLHLQTYQIFIRFRIRDGWRKIEMLLKIRLLLLKGYFAANTLYFYMVFEY